MSDPAKLRDDCAAHTEPDAASASDSSSRWARRRRLLCLALLALALVAATSPRARYALGTVLRFGSGRPALFAYPDTLVLYGPRQFATPNGRATYSVESFTYTYPPGDQGDAAFDQLTLKIQNGNPDGTLRPDSVLVRLNGGIVARTADLSGQAAIERLVHAPAGTTNLLEVTVSGKKNSYVTIQLVSVPSPYFTIPASRRTIDIGTQSSASATVPFPNEVDGGPKYYLHLTNGVGATGLPDSTKRADSVVVVLNGARVLGGAETRGLNWLYKEVALQPGNNSYTATAFGSQKTVSLEVLETDTTAPAVQTLIPAADAVVRDTLLAASGTAAERTYPTVFVNGVKQDVSFDGTQATWGGVPVPLAADGPQQIQTVITDGAGHKTIDTRTVVRDRTAPVLTVSKPADGAGTRDTTVTITGSVEDLTAVTVSANATPLPLTGTNFSGTLPLAAGLNTITITATDAAGNATSIVRQVTFDTIAPQLTLTAPADSTETQASSITVSGSASDATALTLLVNGITVPLGSDGAFSASVPLLKGRNRIEAWATDAAGNRTTRTRLVFRKGPPAFPDTVLQYGPRRFEAAGAAATTQVDTFQFRLRDDDIDGGTKDRYYMRVYVGDPDGSLRPDSVLIRLNGYTVLRTPDIQGRAVVDTVSPGAPSLGAVFDGVYSEFLTQKNVLEVTLRGAPGAFVTLELFAYTSPVFDIQGSLYSINSGLNARSFSLPAGAGPKFYLDASYDRSHLPDSVTIVLNGTRIVSGAGSVTDSPLLKEVALNPTNNQVTYTVYGDSAKGTLSLAATDSAAPVLVEDSLLPAAGAVIADTIVRVSGKVLEQTHPRVYVNSLQADLSPQEDPTYFEVKAVPLPADGSVPLNLEVIDRAGHRLTATRTVIRDRTPPVLSVTLPAEGSATRQSTITLSGTVQDLTAVTLTANGAPVPMSGGSFSQPLALGAGVNAITVTATDAGGNQTSVVRHVTLDTLAPALAVTGPADQLTTEAASITVSGTVADSTTVSLTVNGSAVVIAPDGSFSTTVSLQDGPNTITIQATDAAGNQTTVTRSVTKGESVALPPDPSSVAPALDRTVATTLAAATSFLYTGANPIQTGVAAGTISPTRAAVLRGRVLTRDGQPLSGATITILGHPEFGQTLSRADGMYDLAVNGGASVVLDFARTGFLQAQRRVDVPWGGYARMEDAALVALDSAATTIDFTQPAQVARGSVVSDTDGVRQAKLLFEQGTTAQMVLPDGSTQPLPSLTVRATEYTVGPGGPAAMPGLLPPNSSYTYAAEFSVDEALAAGAKEVRFSKPVAAYVENFLGLPVGIAVPAGYYDRTQGAWVASTNGRVIKILGAGAAGAEIDVNGDDLGDDSASLAALGIDPAERTKLTTLYTSGQSVWRVEVTHFSPWDFNFAYGPPPDATQPPPPDDPPDRPDQPCLFGGSIIECESQVLGERLGLAGTGFTLNYRSGRARGNVAARTLTIPLSGSSVPASLRRIELLVSVAGQTIARSFPAAPNQRTTITWDGRDAYGREVSGAQVAQIRLGYIYGAVYYTAATSRQAFGRLSGIPIASIGGVSARLEIPIYRRWTRVIGTFEARVVGLGGWTVDAHHWYDPIDRRLYLGDGSVRSAANLNAPVKTVAGTGAAGGTGDGGPATLATLRGPTGVFQTGDGSVYIADQMNNVIRRVDPDGTITRIAGNGVGGFLGGDGGPATSAYLNGPHGVSVGPDGTVYIADQANHAIRQVKNGIITRVAGTYDPGYNGDDRPATTAWLNHPRFVVLGPDGALYIPDQQNHRIRRVGRDGIITTVAGTGTAGYSGDGGPATQAKISLPDGVAVNEDGSLYIIDQGNNRIRRVDPTGVISTIAGTGVAGFSGDGGPATLAQLRRPEGIALGPDGSIYFGDTDNNRVRRIGPDGIITTVAGTGVSGYGGENQPAGGALLNHPHGVAVAQDGSILIAEPGNNRVRRIVPVMPGFTNSQFAIASEDGDRLYQFDAAGRHLRTIGTLTRADLFQFGYDAAGRLASITDVDSLAMRIERDASGALSGIVGPFGQRTQLALGADGYLASAAFPSSASVSLTYDSVGLLRTLRDAKQNLHQFQYDTLGRLTRDEDPVGGFRTLARTEGPLSFTVSLGTALSGTTVHHVEQTATGGTRVRITDPTGVEYEYHREPDGRATQSAPGLASASVREGPDGRFGLQAPTLDSASVGTPSGLTLLGRTVRRVILADPNDPLSFTTRTDSAFVNGRVRSARYDVATRQFTSVSAEGRQAVARVDAKGRVVMQKATGVDSVTYTYDAQGRLVSRGQGGRSWTFGYDAAGRLATVSDPLLHVDSLFYDADGRLARRVRPDSAEIRYGYDANDNLVSIAPAGRPEHRFGYDAVDRTAAYLPPDVNPGADSTAFDYNVDGRLTRILRPDGVPVELAYDSAGRLKTITLPRGQVSFSFSPATGTLAGITAPGGNALTFGYDGELVTSATWAGEVSGSVGYTYDNSFRITGTTVNGADSIALQYDRDDLVVTAGALTVTHDSTNGLPTGTTLGGVRTTQSYDASGRLAGLTATYNGNALFQRTFVRDDLDRITQVTETIGLQTTVYNYRYDVLGRLDQVKRDGAVVAAYTYDRNGNRLSYASPNGLVSGAYDAQDRLTTYGTAQYGFTAAGELAWKAVGPDTTRYTYDPLGNLVAVGLPDATQISYVIDGQNRRIGKKVNGTLVQRLLYADQLKPIAELDASGQVLTRFVYGTRPNVPDYMIRGGVTYRLVTDQLGSVRLVVNASTGEVVQRLDYDEFGRVLQDTQPGFQPFGFAGGLYDLETGLVRFTLRDYDSQIGRFTTRDPIGLEGGLNLYLYADGDPVNYVDPLGLCVTLADLLRQLGDLGVGFIPGLSTLQDLLILLSGRNLITAESVGTGGRAIALIGLVTPASSGQIRGGEKLVKHHIFPKRFAEEFKGLVDINQHTIGIPESVHRAIHNGGPRGGDWNKAWEDFFAKGRPHVADVYEYAQKLIRDFGLEGPIGRYR